MRFKEEDVKLLLNNAYVQPSKNYSLAGSNSLPDDTIDVVTDISKIEFVNSQVNAIRRMYVQLPPADKKECQEYLLLYLDSDQDRIQAGIAINALIHIGLFDEAYKKIAIDFEYRVKGFYISLMKIIGLILKYEWNLFTREQIDKIYLWIDDCIEGNNELGRDMRSFGSLYDGTGEAISSLWRKLNIIKTMRLREEIFSETSQEITSDEAALKLEFKRSNFPDYLSEALDRIDLEISTADDNFDFKSCMGLIRSFSESLIKHIAESLDPRDGKKIDGTDSEKAADFFVEKGLISGNEEKLLVALRHFISNEGVHRLKSRPDDARLSRNMVIELSLYLLLRLKDIKGGE